MEDEALIAASRAKVLADGSSVVQPTGVVAPGPPQSLSAVSGTLKLVVQRGEGLRFVSVARPQPTQLSSAFSHGLPMLVW